MTDMLPLTLLAEAAPDPMISGNWILAAIGALASAGALIIGKYQGRKEASARDITIKPPVPTVRTQEEPCYVTMETFNDHLRRIEESIAGIEGALDRERGIARTANSNIHHRIDALSERLGDRLSNLEGKVDGVADTTGKLLDIALHNQPAPSNKR